MRIWRRVGRSGLMMALVMLWVGCSPGGGSSLDLVSELPFALPGSAGLPDGELGDDAMRPFCGGSWGLRVENGKRRTLPGVPYLRFELWQKRPLELSLSGRSHAGDPRAILQLRLNGSPLQKLSLTPREETYKVNLPVSLLREGQNRLEMSSSLPLLWSRARLRPAGVTESADKLSDSGPAGEPVLNLPVGDPIHFALSLSQRASTLRIAEILPWISPGAAPLSEPPQLLVCVRSDQPTFDKTWVLPADEEIRLAMPVQLDQVMLTLQSVVRDPLPGQLGLRLRKPEILFASSLPAPTLAVAGGTPVRREEDRSASVPARPPNVVMYVIDTLRADHLSCYGYKRRTSPNIDALAADGVRFADVTAQSSWTKPATASLLTGLRPEVHGALDYGDRLADSVQTLGELLGDTHQTAAFTTNGFASNHFNMMQGFTETHLSRASADKVQDEVEKWLEQSDPDRPFFLYIHVLDPHLPYQPEQRFDRWSKPGASADAGQFDAVMDRLDGEQLRQAMDLYDGEIAASDHAFGRLMERLKQTESYNDTVVIVTSDHGEEFHEHGGYGHGQTLYQEVVRVPWLLKLPGQVDAGRVAGGVWQHLDVAPTLLSAVGARIPAELPGHAYRAGSGEEPPQRDVFSTLRSGVDAKELGIHDRSFLVFCRALRRGPVTFLECLSQVGRDTPRASLYRLDSDPAQQRDVSDAYPALLMHLRRSMAVAAQADPVQGSGGKADSATVVENLRGLDYLR